MTHEFLKSIDDMWYRLLNKHQIYSTFSRPISYIFQARSIIEKPIFIIGTGRSGTTAIVKGLNLHPKIITMIHESPLISKIGGLVDYIESFENQDYLLNTFKLSKNSLFQCLRNLLFRMSGGPDYAIRYHLKSFILEKQYRSILTRKIYWSTKTFPVYNEYKGLISLYPKAKFIYIVRNGIEVVHSRSKFKGFRDYDFESQCKTYAESFLKYQYLVGNESVFKIRHENLVSDPDKTFKDLFDFLGIDFSMLPSRYVKNNLVHPLDKDNIKGDVKSFLLSRESPYLEWDDKKRKIFKNHCSIAMEQLGYEIPF